jgi:hypothetical protein
MGAYRDEHEEAMERRESMHDREYLDEQRADAYDGQDPDTVRCASYAETACDHAEEAIFGVLNTLSNYLDDSDAAAVIEDVLALSEDGAS